MILKRENSLRKSIDRAKNQTKCKRLSEKEETFQTAYFYLIQSSIALLIPLLGLCRA